MTALDKVLQVYRDTFGIKSDRDNEIHREACEEVARLRDVKAAALKLQNAQAELAHALEQVTK